MAKGKSTAARLRRSYHRSLMFAAVAERVPLESRSVLEDELLAHLNRLIYAVDVHLTSLATTGDPIQRPCVAPEG